MDAIQRGAYSTMIGRMRDTSQETAYRKYYDEARQYIATIKPVNRKGLSLPYRMIYWLHFYLIVRMYVKFMRFIRKNSIKEN